MSKLLRELLEDMANALVQQEQKTLPKYRFDGEEIETPEDLSVAMGITVTEAKARIRHVRTAEGVRKYRQPIGSVIAADVLPEGLPKVKKHSWTKDPHYNNRWLAGKLDDDGYPVKGAEHYGSIRKIAGAEHPYLLQHTHTPTGQQRRSYHSTLQEAKNAYDQKVFVSETKSRRFKPKSKKRYIDKPEWGVYGRDFAYGTDDENFMPDWWEDDNDARVLWAEKAIKDLGIKVNEKTLNPRYTEVIAQHFASMEDSYPGLMTLITHFGGMSDNPNAYAYNKCEFPTVIGEDGRVHADLKNRLTTGIYFNQTMFGLGSMNLTGAAAMQAHGQEGRRWFSARYSVMKNKYPEYGDDQLSTLKTVTHETGHTVARIIFGQLEGMDDRAREPEDRNYYREMFWFKASTVMGNYDLGNADDIYWKLSDPLSSGTYDAHTAIALDDKKTIEFLSEYGGTNLHEMLAEVWAEYQLDPEPRAFSAEMGAIMEEVLEEYLYWETADAEEE